MKRIILLLLVAVAAWYAWQNRDNLFGRQPRHEAVVENSSGREMIRVRVNVDGQAFAKESIPNGEEAVFPFRVDQDSEFRLVWQWAGAMGEQSWSGGMVPRGPMTQRHVMTVGGDGVVVYRATHK